MRSTIAMATFAALAAGTLGVSAKDTIPNMTGSDTLKNITQDVIANCGANCTGLTYIGTGSTAGQNSVEADLQTISPMSRFFNTGICETQVVGGPNTRTSEGLVIALDAVQVVADSGSALQCNDAGEGLLIGANWRDVLRLVYAGMPAGTSTNVLLRDCNSAARRTLLSAWSNIFNAACPTCTDTNPDPGVTETGLRHAFRRDEESGTTDVFLTLLSLGTISYTQNAPSGYPTDAQLAFRALANSPFCNVKRPNDTYLAVTVPPNASRADIASGAASVIPPTFDLGAVPAGQPGGWDHDGNAATAPRLRSLIADPLFDFGNDVTFPEFQDQDPVRRTCVGTGSEFAGPAVAEQVCSADGQLGVVLPINPPPIAVAQAYPSEFCDLGAYSTAPGVANIFGAGIRCENGDEPLGAPPECLVPQTTTGAKGCINGGGSWIDTDPGAGQTLVFAAQGGPVAIYGTTPGETTGRPDIDGRVYNLVLRDSTGNVRTIQRPNPAALGTINTPLVGSFYRIHSTRSLISSNPASESCQKDDATTQIGCLVQASPCSVGYAGGNAVDLNPGTIGLRTNNVLPTTANIQALVTNPSTAFPFSRKLYVNTMRGFHNPLTPFTGTDAEQDLARAFVTHVRAGGAASPTEHGFVELPAAIGGTPFCEDFNENGVCGTIAPAHCTVSGTRTTCGAVNTNACNDTAVTGIPTSTAYCGNGVVDTGEQCDDGNAITDTATAPADPTDDKCSVSCTTTP